MSLKYIEEAIKVLEQKGYTDLQVVACKYWREPRLTHKEDLKVTKE
jgi:hypothetical protein